MDRERNGKPGVRFSVHYLSISQSFRLFGYHWDVEITTDECVGDCDAFCGTNLVRSTCSTTLFDCGNGSFGPCVMTFLVFFSVTCVLQLMHMINFFGKK